MHSILWYGFDSDGKGQILDKSGRAFSAKATEGVKWAAKSKVGGGLVIDNAEISTGKKLGINGSQPRAFAFWIKPAGDDWIDVGVFGLGPSFAVQKENVGRYFYMKTWENKWLLWGCGGAFDWHPGVRVSVGQWVHHVVTYDGSVSRWYVNGEEVGTGFGVKYDTLDTPLRVGKMRAEIDEFMAWNRALSGDEAKLLYNVYK